ncbi:MAG: hypothetical protein LBJ86_07615 [Spirochaetaceae bacterium]|jgi:hypothetical protein|nr:hypothetical protein [Spirochaetaceae bacterium]
MKFEKFTILAVFCAVLFSACVDDIPKDDNEYLTPGIKRVYPDKTEALPETFPTVNTKYEDAVHKADFSNGACAIVLGGLGTQSVYLVTVNTSGSPVDGDNTGGIVLSSLINANMMTQTVEQAEDASWLSKIRLSGGAAAQVFDATGENRQNMAVSCYTTDEINKDIYDAIKKGRLMWGEESSDGMNGGNAILRSVTAAQGTKLVQPESPKSFWVQNKDRTSSLISADLAATGTHCKVWVRRENYDNNSANGNDGKITSVQAQDMADKFDAIYGYETAVFGYEYGGGVPKTDPTYGGLDKDPKIQILVYDIYGDGQSQSGESIVGYFFSSDQFKQSDLDKARFNTKSNEAEMFYIDAFYTDRDTDLIYSTFAHEFQHMIHFHRKTMSTPGRPVSSSWFNEMLSMVAEDLIDPLMGINIDDAAHPASSRIPTFLGYYNSADPTVWQSGYDVLKSYAASYALGAYLVRNFGGVDLVKELISNGYVDTASIDTALRKSSINPVKGVTSFTQALSRFGEVLLFTNAKDNRPAGVLSFNNTVESYVGSTKYTFDGFDIANEYNDIGVNGPLIWGTDKRYSLHPRTLILQTNKGWQSQTGTLSITLSPPSVPGIDMYIIVK